MAVPKADPVAAAEAELIRSQLAEAGVTVTVASVADWNNALLGDAYDLVVTDVGPTADPLALDVRYGRGQATNFTGAPSKALRQALDTLRSTDGQARTDAARQTARVLWTEMPGVPLYQRPQQQVVRADVANYGAPGAGSVTWPDVGYVRSPE